MGLTARQVILVLPALEVLGGLLADGGKSHTNTHGHELLGALLSLHFIESFLKTIHGPILNQAAMHAHDEAVVDTRREPRFVAQIATIPIGVSSCRSGA